MYKYLIVISVLHQTAPAPVAEAVPENRQEQEEVHESDTESKTPSKRKTKSQLDKEDQMDKILKLAQQEDHPVELALLAIGKKMIRTLSKDEQDELLEEIQEVQVKFFRERRKRMRLETAQKRNQEQRLLPPPPPLQAGPSNAVQHAAIEEDSGMLVEVSQLPPLEQYNVQYVREEGGATYMKL